MKHSIKTAVSMVLCLALLLTSSTSFSNQATLSTPLEKVTLQLKWFHQFQFAGYYAAKEQGYYAEEGLDVAIFERSPDKDVVQQVVSGERDFGVGDSGILSYYARGEPIVALAAIFQHNPLVFISKQSSGIISPYEMKGKRIMFDSMGMDDSVLQAVLAEAHLSEKNYTTVKQSFRNDDLIENKIDVMSGYLSDAIFYFQQKKIKINIINPQNYGIDFYGDLLFTSQHELIQHQGRAEKFRRASLKGWQYALDHPEELIQLIRKKYHCRLSVTHLRFEAEVTRKLIMPDVIPLGQIDAERLRKVAEMYAQLNISKPLSEKKLARFIARASRSDDKPLIVGSEEDFPPFTLGKTDETADGFTVELWRAVAEEAHLKSTIRVLPWKQVLAEFKAEKIDVLINFASSDERRQFADFTEPHFVSYGAIFARDKQSSIHSETDLNNKSIIVVNADLAHKYAVLKGWQKQLVLVDTLEEGFKLLAAGQHDALLVNKLTGQKTLKKLQLANITWLPLIKLELAYKLSFAVHKGDAELLAKINEGLALVKANGTYDRLYEKWFSVHEVNELLPLLIKYLAVIIIVFLLILLVIFYVHSVERKRATKQLAQRERHLRAIINEATGCIKLVAHDGTLLSMNPSGLATIAANSEDEVRNNSVYLLISPEFRAAYQAFNEAVCDGTAGNMEYEIIDLKGGKHWMSTYAVPFNMENGDCVQLAFTQDITERKQIEERLHILSVAVEQSPTSVVITDLNANLLYVNPRFTEVTGYSAEEALGKNPSILQSGLTNEDTYTQLWDILEQGEIWQGELINRRKNGEVYWEDVHIAPIKNSAGVTTNYVGVKLDITERKRIETALKKSNIELQQYFNQPFIGMLSANHHKKTIAVNQCFCDMVGYTQAEMQTIDWVSITHPDDLASNQAYLEQAIRGEIDAYQMEKRYIHKDGHLVYVDLAVQCVRLPNGEPNYFIGMMQDITERKAAEEEIKQLAFFDPLTGLPNRRKLLDRLQYSIALNRRTNSQFAVFMMDLDKFKAVNDNLGHAAGDELLKQVAARIINCLRDSDMVARLGGDEFVLVLENLKIPDDAETIALKIIADLTVPFQLSENNTVQIGASIGISLYPQHGETPEILMDHADTALYKAKDNGRGCFAHFSEAST